MVVRIYKGQREVTNDPLYEIGPGIGKRTLVKKKENVNRGSFIHNKKLYEKAVSANEDNRKADARLGSIICLRRDRRVRTTQERIYRRFYALMRLCHKNNVMVSLHTTLMALNISRQEWEEEILKNNERGKAYKQILNFLASAVEMRGFECKSPFALFWMKANAGWSEDAMKKKDETPAQINNFLILLEKSGREIEKRKVIDAEDTPISHGTH